MFLAIQYRFVLSVTRGLSAFARGVLRQQDIEQVILKTDISSQSVVRLTKENRVIEREKTVAVARNRGI